MQRLVSCLHASLPIRTLGRVSAAWPRQGKLRRLTVAAARSCQCAALVRPVASPHGCESISLRNSISTCGNSVSDTQRTRLLAIRSRAQSRAVPGWSGFDRVVATARRRIGLAVDPHSLGPCGSHPSARRRLWCGEMFAHGTTGGRKSSEQQAAYCLLCHAGSFRTGWILDASPAWPNRQPTRRSVDFAAHQRIPPQRTCPPHRSRVQRTLSFTAIAARGRSKRGTARRKCVRARAPPAESGSA